MYTCGGFILIFGKTKQTLEDKSVKTDVARSPVAME